MKNVLSLLFVLITLGVSVPLFAGDLIMSNEFRISGAWSDTYSVDMSDDLPTTTSSASDTWTQGLTSRGAYEIQKGVSISWEIEAYSTQWGYDTTSEDAEFSWRTMYATWEAERFTLDAGYIDCNLGTYASTNESGGFALEFEPLKGFTVQAFAVLDSENAEYDYIDDDFYYAEYDEDTDEWTYSSVETNGSLTDDDDEQDSYSFGFSITHDLPTGEPVQKTSDVVDWVNEDEDEMTGGGPGGAGMENAVAAYLAVAIDQAYGTETYAAGVDAGYTFMDIKISAFAGTFWGNSYSDMGPTTGTVDIEGLATQFSFEKELSDTLTATLNLYWTPGDTDAADDVSFYASWTGMGESKMLTDGGGVELMPMMVSFTSYNDAGVYGGSLSGEYTLNKQTRLESGVVYGIPAIDYDDQSPMDAWESILQLNTGYTYEVSEALEFQISASVAQIEGSSSYEDAMWGTSAGMTFAF
jgi:hypothetical protein